MAKTGKSKVIFEKDVAVALGDKYKLKSTGEVLTYAGKSPNEIESLLITKQLFENSNGEIVKYAPEDVERL